MSQPASRTEPNSLIPTAQWRIQRLSRRLSHVCLALIIVIPLVLLPLWAFAPTEMIMSSFDKADIINGELVAWQRVAGAVITFIPLVFLMVALGYARRCFRQFADGHLFELPVVKSLRGFAANICYHVIAGFFATPLLTVSASWNNGPGHRILNINFDSQDVMMLMFSGMMWLIASVMTHAAALADENARFV